MDPSGSACMVEGSGRGSRKGVGCCAWQKMDRAGARASPCHRLHCRCCWGCGTETWLEGTLSAPPSVTTGQVSLKVVLNWNWRNLERLHFRFSVLRIIKAWVGESLRFWNFNKYLTTMLWISPSGDEIIVNEKKNQCNLCRCHKWEGREFYSPEWGRVSISSFLTWWRRRRILGS